MGADEYFRLCESIRLDLLELYGSGYVIDHCIAAFHAIQEEKGYRMYVTDALKAIAENSARYIVRGVSEPIEFGATMRSRWADLGEEPVKKKDEPEDNRTCAEIAGDIWSRIRGD